MTKSPSVPKTRETPGTLWIAQRRRRVRAGVVVVAATIVCGSAAGAQRVNDGSGNSDLTGTPATRYLRYLQLRDTLAHAQWSMQAFSEPEKRALYAHLPPNPWNAHLQPARGRAVAVDVLPLSAGVRFNSGFPYSGGDDGAVWTGRGMTLVAQGGIFARLGPLSLRLEPLAFRAQNTNFDVGFGASCPPQCVTGPNRTFADFVQRFGDRPYQRLDPGNSTLRLDLFHLTAGASTANESWGPSEAFPFLLGPNAAGFPHAFAGTSEPLNVLVGSLSLRVLYGRLDQSAYSPDTGSRYYFLPSDPGRIRFASGFLTVFQPRGITGLEIGAGRFMHSPWLSTGIPPSYLRKPFQAFLKKPLIARNFDNTLAGLDNELASAFARWVFPAAGLEVYGEYGRDDHAYDFRDLAQEPDHDRAYSLGLRKLLTSTSEELTGFRVELINFQEAVLARSDRGEGNVYTHSSLRQGHTNLGQLLGAPVGIGTGAASVVAYDKYTATGGWSVKWERTLRREEGDFFTSGITNPKGSDVLHSLGVERTKFGREIDLRSSVTLMREFNRNFASDVTNLNIALTMTRHGARTPH